MADAPKTPPTKIAAITAAAAALMLVAVLYFPPLLPVCKALAWCPADMVVTPAVVPAP